ncbi:MAG: cobalamin B12-binding domain-containing protein [Caldilineaceae bacterium]
MKTVVAAALGECVHVAGVSRFLQLAEEAGWRTVFLGPATPVEAVVAAAREHRAELVGVSYRLTPETGERLLADFAEAADDLRSSGVSFAFGGTPPLAARAEQLGFFARVFAGGEADEEVLAFLKGAGSDADHVVTFPQRLVDRIAWKAPFPLLRHHYGQPTMAESLAGIEQIAEARVLDVISLGIDQDAQENFFHPDRQDPRRRGAGGVPVRTAEEYRALYAAGRRGNWPLLRTYSGTDDFIRLAQMYVETINIAWCAIPLFWFNRMDGRGPWDLEGSIREHQAVMAWYGERGIPVELNEPHHWGMRDAPDVVFVVSAFLAAYNARAFGVRDYIAQLMFNSPAGHSDAMDLAKMLAVLVLIEPLERRDFRIWRQTRTGLLSYPVEPSAARAHLATSVYLQMALHPHIVHVVGHSEAHHAATADDVIESCLLARRAIQNALRGMPDMTRDAEVQRRCTELVTEASTTLGAIVDLAGPGSIDPFIDPAILGRAVRLGILDAPQLRSNPVAPGRVKTRILGGACVAVDSHGQPLSEADRIQQLIKETI